MSPPGTSADATIRLNPVESLRRQSIDSNGLRLRASSFDTRPSEKKGFEGAIVVTPDGIKGADAEKMCEEEESDGRQQWSNPIEFLFSCISMSVGLGNIWRFPFIAYENGGGAFLIPYLLVLFFIGKPIYYLEMALGQFSGRPTRKVFDICPIIKGVAYAQIVALCSMCTFYSYIMSITLFYFFNSFRKVLPWSFCDPEWADSNCFVVSDSSGEDAKTRAAAKLRDLLQDNDTAHLVSSSEQYFNEYVVHLADPTTGIDDGIGTPDWKLVLCLFGFWVALSLITLKGVQSSGKAAYFTTLFPYVVLLLLLIKGSTLSGAVDGIKYFVIPDWKKLYDVNVWFNAIGQCFFSLNVGFGAIMMYSSYNNFNHNCYRDSNIISIMDTFTSLLSGFATFAILGHLAHVLDRPIEKVVQSGVGMTFITYPDAIAQFDKVPQLFAVLFFLMMLCLGIGSIMSASLYVINFILDRFPKLNRIVVTSAFGCFAFGVSIIYTTPGGQYLVGIMDFYGCNFIIYIMSFLEVTAVAWIYGLRKIRCDIKFMNGHDPGIYWKACWLVIVPVIVLFSLIYTWATWEFMKFGPDYVYPVWSMVMGWMISAAAILIVIGFAVYVVYKQEGDSLKEKFLASVRATEGWSPKSNRIKEEWKAWQEQKLGLKPTWAQRVGFKKATPDT